MMRNNIAKRHKYILERIKSDGYVKVADLSHNLSVSEVTIRKDLKYLENKRLLYRSHGSAGSISSIINEMHVDEKEKIKIDEKNRIAVAANDLLEPNDKIIIASGTTILAFAFAIDGDKNLTVITSSVKVSGSLCYKPNIDVIQLGGMIRRSAVSVIGSYAEDILQGLVCNKLFMGVDGIDMDYGLTTSDMNEARLNQQMIASAEEVIILTDSSKFGKKGFCKICDIDKIHHIITDKDVSPNIVALMRDKGIKVTIV